MGVKVQEASGSGAEQREIARFLSDFVRRGGLNKPRPGDDEATCWERRLGWWWDDNPMRRNDSPLGFILYSEEGKIVGFHGFIPLDYEIDGEIVPSLLATTFFVEKNYRDAVMGVLMRLRRLATRYQIVDGSPSAAMRELYARIGFLKEDQRHQYFFPLRPFGGRISRGVLSQIGVSVPLARPPKSGDYLARIPEEVESIPVLRDGKLRRRLSIESLQWLTTVGTEPRNFFGLCDAKGTLQAYAIGVYKERFGVRACMLLDTLDLTGDQSGLEPLLHLLTRSPFECGVARETDVITWSTLNRERYPAQRGLSRRSILHYLLPPGRSAGERASVPFESDIPLL